MHIVTNHGNETIKISCSKCGNAVDQKVQQVNPHQYKGKSETICDSCAKPKVSNEIIIHKAPALPTFVQDPKKKAKVPVPQQNIKIAKDMNLMQKENLQFSCTICLELFASEELRRTHMNLDKFICELCFKQFCSDVNLTKHRQDDHKPTPMETVEVANELEESNEGNDANENDESVDVDPFAFVDVGAAEENKSNEETDKAKKSVSPQPSPKVSVVKKARKEVQKVRKEIENVVLDDDVICEETSPPPTKKFKKGLKCDRCDQLFSHEKDKKIHQERPEFHEKGLKMCKFCSFKSCGLTGLESHALIHRKPLSYVDVNDEVDFWKCDNCGKQFYIEASLAYHKKTCTGKKSPTKVLSHLPKATNTSQEKFKCDKCSQEFKSELYKKSHEKSNRCEYCLFNSCTRFAFTNHMKNYHNKKSQKYPCDRCDMEFAMPTERIAHFKSKNYVLKSLRMICIICSFRACTEVGLKEHHKKAHPELTPESSPQAQAQNHQYKCDKCNTFRSSSKDALELHQKLEHSQRGAFRGMQKYKCDKCNELFDTLEETKSHQEESHCKMYKCNECPESFKQVEDLKTHKSTDHSSVKFKCDQCDTFFDSMKETLEHQKKIHSALTFKCDKCVKAFATLEELKEHQKSDHPAPVTKYKVRII